ncbi:AraC family transcriptional regulator [Pandoraea sputorum]|uniref:helix-turn-helix transcriptional regulator n=1 Tax=Pandoraea sputorum TaxID=93222 RepID=UPI001E57479E|nr:AraC family transcriptional regulator [Pandoraea sputorum]MCE4058895.1 AraC family transcriptional regulator [Pandoraea sputorum]
MVTSQPWRHAVDLDGLSLVRGIQQAQAGASVRESLAGGDIKIVFLLDGALQWAAGGTPLLDAGAGTVNVCFGDSPLDIDNLYGESSALRYFSLRLSERYLIAACGLDAHALTRGWREGADGGAGLPACGVQGDWCGTSAVLTRAMSAEEWRWASAMTSLHADGSDDDTCWQRLALIGQTFEALARCAAYTTGASGASLAPDTPRMPGISNTSNAFSASCVPITSTATDVARVASQPISQDIESHRDRVTRRAVFAARDVLNDRLQAPPSLPLLAREVGINVNKLCAGFRQQFGTTVHGYVRERRLATAFELLSARRISVSEAAWQCGYTDSHFAKVFRARFGMLPNTLTRETATLRG